MAQIVFEHSSISFKDSVSFIIQSIKTNSPVTQQSSPTVQLLSNQVQQSSYSAIKSKSPVTNPVQQSSYSAIKSNSLVTQQSSPTVWLPSNQVQQSGYPAIKSNSPVTQQSSPTVQLLNNQVQQSSYSSKCKYFKARVLHMKY